MNSSLYGLAAEFDDPDKILEAVHKMKAAGYRQMDAYTPFPVHGMTEALDCHDPKVPWIVFLMGIFGTVNGYMLEYTTSTPVLDHLPRFVRNLPGMNEMSYPMNIGGRPFHSWPNFIPVAFETTILFAALGAVVGMLLLNGLPRPYHSIFNAPRFELVSQDKFLLCIEAADPKFDYEATWQFLQSLGPDLVSEVAK
jgi:Protein of unknown function (DUF3341)